MALFVMGDLHLSLSSDKSMDIFGGWENYVERIKENWNREVSPEDTVVVPGDISWAMSLKEAGADFRYIHELPGRKIILKGNHDYWWTTAAKMNNFLAENGFDSIFILHNNHYAYENYGICGTRGWINDDSEPADAKVLAREAQRLETSIASAENAGLEPLVFLHYPPLYGNEYNPELLEVMYRHNIKRCWYGHIHGRKGHQNAVNGERDGIVFQLVSADYVQFCPVKIM
ncbi:MAG: metallophosphoesterase [Oscillospiraceae bacterium]|nr:metallophosphoesterase [Oscillospiraceae bacterium]